MFASIDDVAIGRRTLERLTVLRPPHHTGQALILIPSAAQRPVWAPGVRVSSRLDISTHRSRLRRSRPPGPGLRGAGCPAPAAIVEQLHAQLHRMHAGPCQAPVGVVGRSVGEAAVALATVAG